MDVCYIFFNNLNLNICYFLVSTYNGIYMFFAVFRKIESVTPSNDVKHSLSYQKELLQYLTHKNTLQTVITLALNIIYLVIKIKLTSVAV